MSLSAMTDIIDPYHFTAGSAPLLISIPHAGTQLTPEVDNGLSDAARPLAIPTGIFPACTILLTPSAPVCWSGIIPVLLST